MKKLSRREFLRALWILPLAAQVDPASLLPDPRPEPVAKPGGIKAVESIQREVNARIAETVRSHQEWGDIGKPANLSEWFDEVCWMIRKEAYHVPQNTREMQFYLPAKIDDFDLTRRFTCDWYNDKRRYGFKIVWHDWCWPEPWQVLMLARPYLANTDPDAFLAKDCRWIPSERTAQFS